MCVGEISTLGDALISPLAIRHSPFATKMKNPRPLPGDFQTKLPKQILY
jgi:hypothetical protein